MEPYPPGARFRRASHINLRWVEGEKTKHVVNTDGTLVNEHIDPQAVTLLQLFGEGRSWTYVRDLLLGEEAPTRAVEEAWARATALIDAGSLVPLDSTPDEAPRREAFHEFEDFDYHVRMLSDSRRMSAYAAAIERVVRPGMRVLEIGAGTGVLSVLAAKQGADVVAIEQAPVIEIAREMAADAGVADKIRFIQKKSTQVELDHKADVLITELVGNRVLNERMLEMTLDAKKRLLEPGAIFLPRALHLDVMPIEREFGDGYEVSLSAAGERLGLSFEAMARWMRAERSTERVIEELGPHDSYTSLGPAQRVASFDLATLGDAGLDITCDLPIERLGEWDSVVFAFGLDLCEGVALDNLPSSSPTHWHNASQVLPISRRVTPGTTVRIHVTYSAFDALEARVVSLDEGARLSPSA